MFPKIINNKNFFKKTTTHKKKPPLTPQNKHQQSKLHFTHHIKLPHTINLTNIFLPITSTLISHPPPN